jgi:hypothetical protein
MNFNPLKSVTPAAPNSNIMGNVTNAFSNIWIILGIVVVVAVLCYVYYKKIGYYVTLGIDNLTDVIKGRQTVSAEFGAADNMDAPGDLVATLKPMDQMGSMNQTGSMNRIDEGSPPHPNLPSVLNRPSGMPGAQSGQPGTFLSSMLPHPNFSTGGKQVFNVSRNIYTYHDAAAVCSALDADLATYDQVKDAYDQGGDWCNYGWVKGQMAVYPTQKETYEKLQKGHPQYHNACGRPGINGGYFDNPELLFGVNCFGVRPAKNAMDELNNSEVALPPTTDEIEFEKRVQKFRDELENTTVLPFNKNSWSG